MSSQGAAALSAALGLNLRGLLGGGQADTLFSAGRTAMACRFEVMVPDPACAAVAGGALALVEALEQQLSVFRPESEVCAINRDARGGQVEVERGLFSLLSTCKRLHEETGGAFDAAQGNLSSLWRRCGATQVLPSEEEVTRALSAGGMERVTLDRRRGTVAFAGAGAAFDLGAIGKGYAVDRICERLRAGGVRGALVHAGHSSIYALGGLPGGRDWLVSLRDPRDAARAAAQVRLRDQAMATSGSLEQSFETGGKRRGHIVDPRSGWPAEGVLSATAFAPTAAEADALSTAFYVMGVEQTEAYCARHRHVGALMICEDGRLVNAGIASDSLEVLV